MIQLNDVQKEKINFNTLVCYPYEMCGILTEDDFIFCPNIHENPKTNFKISPKDLLPYLGKVKAIVHSHCKDSKTQEVFDIRTPSVSDLEGQTLSGVSWLIVSCNGSTVSSPLEFPRQPSNNYIGRPFIWLINDCYTLVQDFYFFELGISLPNHKAKTDYRDIRTLNGLFDDFIVEYNFRPRHEGEPVVTGNLLLLNHKGSVRNHLGIYNKGKVIHQDMLSVEVDFERMLPYIAEVLVYEG